MNAIQKYLDAVMQFRNTLIDSDHTGYHVDAMDINRDPETDEPRWVQGDYIPPLHFGDRCDLVEDHSAKFSALVSAALREAMQTQGAAVLVPRIEAVERARLTCAEAFIEALPGGFESSPAIMVLLQVINAVHRVQEVQPAQVSSLDIPSKPVLCIDVGALAAKWGRVKLHINAGHDFTILKRLHASAGKVVSYVDLLMAIKPDAVSPSIDKLSAPPEVKDAASHIRAAFEKAGCPWTIASIRGKGFILRPPDE